MIREAMNQLKTACIMLVLLTGLTGLVYPLLVTALAQLCFPGPANGSLITHDGAFVGSSLIGQPFSATHYFWGRPSATSPFPYNGEASSGSNSGPTNPEFLKTVKERIEYLKQSNPLSTHRIPVDLVTASGSGLDPEITPLAAYYQVPRVAKARHLSERKVLKLVQEHSITRLWGLFGKPRVNVLELNIALDNLRTDDHGKPTS